MYMLYIFLSFEVRSVNLDSWSPEQVAHMQHIGNSVARAVYEAHLPDNFRRPQSDSSVQAFIQAKYEQKRYIMKDWQPPKIEPRNWPTADDPVGKPKSKPKPAPMQPVVGGLQPPPCDGTAPGPALAEQPVRVKRATSPKPARPNGALGDLVDLAPPQHPHPPHVASTPNLAAASASIGTTDLLGLMSGPVPPLTSTVTTPGTGHDLQGLQNHVVPASVSPKPVDPSQHAGGDASLLGGSVSQDSGKKTTTDILALYSSGKNVGQGVTSNGIPPNQSLPQGGSPAFFMGGSALAPGQGSLAPSGMPPTYPQSGPAAYGGFASAAPMPQQVSGGFPQNQGFPNVQPGPGIPYGASMGQFHGMAAPQAYPGMYGQAAGVSPYAQGGMPQVPMGYQLPPGQTGSQVNQMGPMTNQFASMQMSGQNPGFAPASTLSNNLWR